MIIGLLNIIKKVNYYITIYRAQQHAKSIISRQRIGIRKSFILRILRKGQANALSVGG